MKKFVSVMLSILMIVSLAACGVGSTEQGPANDGAGNAANGEVAATGESAFKVGFGVVDITPNGSVSMSGYGDHNTRFSEGFITRLEARCLAVIDENDEKLLLITVDISFAYPAQTLQAIKKVEKKLGIPQDHIVVSGTHTHNSVATWMTSVPGVVEFNNQYVEGILESATIALEDAKPAQMYLGSVMTENLNFVRRYYMDDGSLVGDGTYGTGTTIVSHESDADGEMQLMKFVREGGKDILVAQFQAHPHLEGKSNNLSAQTPATFRNYMEDTKDIYCLYWNGAGGNINSKSRIDSENRTSNQNEYGKLLGDYAIEAYDTLTPAKTGPIKVVGMDFKGKVNHTEHDKISDAQKVVDYFNECNDATKTAQYGAQFGVHTLQHANRIIANSKLGETSNLTLFAWSFGDASGVVAEYEMFDTNGMEIKTGTPFERTFIICYSYPACQGYVASALGYQNGGYEVDNGTFAPGTGEELVEAYLGMLNELKG